MVMAESVAKKILVSLLEHLKPMISSKGIVGNPIEVGESTNVPVMKASL
jgi:uncharacterized spore protein YtfJ